MNAKLKDFLEASVFWITLFGFVLLSYAFPGWTLIH